MINFFKAYSLIWILILILYKLKWSNYCTTLLSNVIAFVLVLIILTFTLGNFIDKGIKKEENIKLPDFNDSKLFKIVCAILLFSFIYSKNIPIIEVAKGKSIADVNFGLPFFNIIIVSMLIYYSFYLSARFAIKKNKKDLVKCIVIILYFCLLVQRQNIIICALFLINDYYYFNKTKKSMTGKKHKLIKFVSLCIVIVLLLYVFGLVGNRRFGSMWKATDSSMITNLGSRSKYYPNWLPREYFWSYIYLVDPLINLNNNVKYMQPNRSASDFLLEFVPNVLEDKLSISPSIKPFLAVKSLNVSTAYIGSYLSIGILGMYIMLFIQLLFCTIISILTLKHNREMLIPNLNALTYFLILSFFDNPFNYSPTYFILVLAFIFSLKYNLKKGA